jgi:hypothetical protein
MIAVLVSLPTSVLLRVIPVRYELTDAEWFAVAVAVLMGFFWLVIIAVRVLPRFLRDTLSWCRRHLGPSRRERREFVIRRLMEGDSKR